MRENEYPDSYFGAAPEKYVPRDPEKEVRHIVKVRCLCDGSTAEVELFTEREEPCEMTGFNGCACYPSGHEVCARCADRAYLAWHLPEKTAKQIGFI